jgi:uncharacterized protein (DUF58 family)
MIRLDSPTRPATIDELLSPELVARLTALDYTSRKLLTGKLKGERRSKRRGQSVEFADHRPYTRGDDLRHIDWAIYARLERLVLKLFLEEEDLSLHVVVDASASLDCGNPSKWLFTQRAAMALAYIGLVNYNRVSVTAIGGSGEVRNTATQSRSNAEGTSSTASRRHSVTASLSNLRGRRRARDVADFLCNLTPAGSAPFTDACKRIALSRKGKGIMILLSDFLIKEGYEQGLRLLLGRGYDLFAIQVLSPQEVDPAGPNGLAGDLRLKDTEDDDRAEITISQPLLKRYKATLAAYTNQLRQFCAQRDVRLLTLQSDTPLDTLILDLMRKQGVLR